MAIHKTHGLGYEVPLRAGKPKEHPPIARYLIEGLPLIGPSMANALLSHFGSAHAVFNATVEELVQVKGVGKLTAEKMFMALRAPI